MKGGDCGAQVHLWVQADHIEEEHGPMRRTVSQDPWQQVCPVIPVPFPCALKGRGVRASETARPGPGTIPSCLHEPLRVHRDI